MYSPPGLHFLLPILSMWISYGLAAPVSMPLSEVAAYPMATEAVTFTTLYWSYTTPSSIPEPADGLPPLASVFSAMAHQTTLPPSPSPVSHHGGPGIVVVEDPASTSDVATCPDASKSKVRKFEIITAVLGTVASIQAVVVICLAICFCRRGIRKNSRDRGDKLDWWKEEGAVDDKGMDEQDDRRARQSWWNDKVVDIRGDSSAKLVAPLAAPTPLSPITFSLPNPHPHPNFPPLPIQITQHQTTHLSSSTPLLHSPSPISSNPVGAGLMTTAEFLASLDLNRNSTASTSSSFTTAETHPDWITHAHPPAQTPPQDHSRTKSAPPNVVGDSGRNSQESTRSEWDIAKWYSGTVARHDKAKSTGTMDGT